MNGCLRQTSGPEYALMTYVRLIPKQKDQNMLKYSRRSCHGRNLVRPTLRFTTCYDIYTCLNHIAKQHTK